ncbi:MAG: hypothetical protein KBD19_00560 [Candidatus Moranbacteria bacterium]|nr:hypothetical protein [Candidatus Moranbacteria bacterium]
MTQREGIGMPLIFAGFVLLFLIAVFAPYVNAIAATFIIAGRLVVAFFISLIPLGFLIVSIVAVYLGFQDMRRELRRPRRRVGSDGFEDF